MPELNIQIVGARAVPYAAVPTLAFQLQIINAPCEEEVHTIALRCQVQIEVTRRGYAPQEQERLLDIFGRPERWGQTLRNLLWTHASLMVPRLEAGRTIVDLCVPCSFDFNVVATKYFEGLAGGDIPLLMLFSGTIFYATPESALQVAPIPWELEARCQLPVRVWREMMDIYYPHSVWINLHRDAFDRLYQYKMEHGIPTWEQALDHVLACEAGVKA